MPIRIGEDGAIINGDEIISSSGTIIREDGTIESTNIAGAVPQPQRPRISHAAPVSPLENRVAAGTTQTASPQEVSTAASRESAGATSKKLADLEYDLMVVEGRAKGAIQRGPIVALIVTILLGFAFPPLFIGTAIAGYMLYSNNQKKINYEAEAQRIRDEISVLKKQGRG